MKKCLRFSIVNTFNLSPRIILFFCFVFTLQIFIPLVVTHMLYYSHMFSFITYCGYMANKCYVMLCYVMLCYVMLCYVMLCYVMLCYVMLCHVMLCYVMLCYVMLCYVMLCYVMLCYVMLCYVMLCYVMLCYIVPGPQTIQPQP